MRLPGIMRKMPEAVRIIPVLDVQGGVAVHAIAGNRQDYRPLASRWSESADPAAVAKAMRQRCGFKELYLADLDAILGQRPSPGLYAELQSLGFELWLDAGIRTAENALGFQEIAHLVVGLETIASPEQLARIVHHLGPERMAFSLDMKNGRPMRAWGDSPIEVGNQAISAGVRKLVVLDLARVGVSSGLGTEPLLKELSRQHPEIELIAGGGVRGREDLERLAECGASAALVGTALHNGSLP